MTGLFFTGTDTGVGKTVVSAAVARLLRGQGCRVRVSKPVATGAKLVNGRWLADDTIRLAEAAGTDELTAITPWVFAEPAAPPVAARLAGETLDLEQLIQAARRQGEDGTIVIVEGVGGLLCPLTERATVANLAEALGLPLVVVTRRSLGTLNHTLLTLEAARSRDLAVAGVVVSETSPPESAAERANVEELARRIDVPLLAVVPHGAEATIALTAVDWRQLCGGAAGDRSPT